MQTTKGVNYFHFFLNLKYKIRAENSKFFGIQIHTNTSNQGSIFVVTVFRKMLGPRTMN